MIEHVHTHITSELNQNARTDTIFILSSIILNLIALAINSAQADNKRSESALTVMIIITFLVIVVNVVVIVGLSKGKQMRIKLTSGLLRMYRDKDVDKYYDESLLSNYKIRYTLFTIVVVTTGLIAICIPFIIR